MPIEDQPYRDGGFQGVEQNGHAATQASSRTEYIGGAGVSVAYIAYIRMEKQFTNEKSIRNTPRGKSY